MKAVRENKVYRIETESQKQRYLKEGFDIYDDEGKILEHSPKKKIAYGEYAKLQEENKALLAELAALKENAGKTDADEEKVIGILTAYAQEHEIDLGRASTVAGIVKKITDSKAGDE